MATCSSNIVTPGTGLTRGSMPSCSRYGLKMRAPPMPSSPAVAPETARIPTATSSTLRGFLSPTLHAMHGRWSVSLCAICLHWVCIEFGACACCGQVSKVNRITQQPRKSPAHYLQTESGSRSLPQVLLSWQVLGNCKRVPHVHCSCKRISSSSKTGGPKKISALP